MVRHARCRWEPLVVLAIGFCTSAVGVELQSASVLKRARGGGEQLVPDLDQGRLLDDAEAELLDPKLRRLIVNAAGAFTEVLSEAEEELDPVTRQLVRLRMRHAARDFRRAYDISGVRTGRSESSPKLAATVNLELLDATKYGKAKCMDGSMGGFYYKPASTPAAKNNWLVHMQGGGECDTLVRCTALTLTALGTSSMFPWQHSFAGGPDVRVMMDTHTVEGGKVNETHLGLFHHDREVIGAMPTLQVANRDINPLYYDWNMVFLPYCSQDLWVGQRTATSPETFGLYFSGLHIVDAIISTLDTKYNMKAAANIIVSGDSAGGYGAFHHVDRIAAVHPTAQTVGAPIGGLWTYVHPYMGANTTGETLFSDFREFNWPRMKALWQAYSLATCPHAEAHCMVGCSVQPWPWTYTKSRLFIAEAVTDSVLSTMHNWLPTPPRDIFAFMQHNPESYSPAARAWLEAWGANMTACLRSGAKLMQERSKVGPPQIGIFSPSCFTHTEFAEKVKIGGKNLMVAFDDFFHARPSAVNHLHMETGFQQNPACRKHYFFPT